jgi:hypothetical protein
LSAFALDQGDARYVGGTVPGVTAGDPGRLDTTSTPSLTFDHAGNTVEIPYAAIESYDYSKYDYSKEVTRHLGVLPAIAVGWVKMRRHGHYFSISYRTENGGPAQIVVFEVPKDMPRTLKAILQTRAPGTCKPCLYPSIHTNCGLSNYRRQVHYRNCPKRASSVDSAALCCPHEKSTNHRSLVADFGSAPDFSRDRANRGSADCRRTP